MTLTPEQIEELAEKYAAAKGSGNVAVVSDAAMSFFHKGPSLLQSARENAELRGWLRAVELRVDGLNTKAYRQKPETQAALDDIKAHCRAALAGEHVTATPTKLAAKNAELRKALESAEDALARCYDVADWPADGKTRQDIALGEVRAALKRGEP